MPVEQAHNVRPYIQYTEAFRLTGDGAPGSSRPTEIYIATALPESTAAFAAPGQRFDLQAPEASRGEGGRAAADAYSMAEDGGALSGYRLLCESHRRRVRSAMVGRRTGLPKVRRVLGFLGGSESGLCLPAGG